MGLGSLASIHHFMICNDATETVQLPAIWLSLLHLVAFMWSQYTHTIARHNVSATGLFNLQTFLSPETDLNSQYI